MHKDFPTRLLLVATGAAPVLESGGPPRGSGDSGASPPALPERRAHGPTLAHSMIFHA